VDSRMMEKQANLQKSDAQFREKIIRESQIVFSTFGYLHVLNNCNKVFLHHV